MNILNNLSKPFHPAQVTWKPGATTRDKSKALGMAYADLRAYQNRLDEVCGMNWAVSYTPWGDSRVVCHLTIDGVTRSSTGEMDGQSEKSEIGGTAAEAQAFKRACAMFGLGRYLYNLPTIWAEFDSEKRQFTEQGKARLNGIIISHYRRNADSETQAQPGPDHMGESERSPSDAGNADTAPSAEDEWNAIPGKDVNGDKRPPQNGNGGGNGNGNVAKLLDVLRAEGRKTVGKEASEKQHQFAAGVLDGLTQDGAHTAIWEYIHGREVANEDGKRCNLGVARYILDRAREGADDYDERIAEVFRQLWRVVQEEAGQQQLIAA